MNAPVLDLDLDRVDRLLQCMPDGGNAPAPGPADVPGYVNGVVHAGESTAGVAVSETRDLAKNGGAQSALQRESSYYGGGGNASNDGRPRGKSNRSLGGAMQEGRAAAQTRNCSRCARPPSVC